MIKVLPRSESSVPSGYRRFGGDYAQPFEAEPKKKLMHFFFFGRGVIKYLFVIFGRKYKYFSAIRLPVLTKI